MTLHQEDHPLLVAQEGPLKGQRWQLSRTIMLGREPTCDIVIVDRSEIITSPVTDFGTVAGIIYQGCIPIFAD